MKKIIPVIIIVAVILIANSYWVTYYYNIDEKNGPVEILVVDDFTSDDVVEELFGSTTSHGKMVANTAKQWCLGSCKIRTFNAYLHGKHKIRTLSSTELIEL